MWKTKKGKENSAFIANHRKSWEVLSGKFPVYLLVIRAALNQKRESKSWRLLGTACGWVWFKSSWVDRLARQTEQVDVRPAAGERTQESADVGSRGRGGRGGNYSKREAGLRSLGAKGAGSGSGGSWGEGERGKDKSMYREWQLVAANLYMLLLYTSSK